MYTNLRITSQNWGYEGQVKVNYKLSRENDVEISGFVFITEDEAIEKSGKELLLLIAEKLKTTAQEQILHFT